MSLPTAVQDVCLSVCLCLLACAQVRVCLCTFDGSVNHRVVSVVGKFEPLLSPEQQTLLYVPFRAATRVVIVSVIVRL